MFWEVPKNKDRFVCIKMRGTRGLFTLDGQNREIYTIRRELDNSWYTISNDYDRDCIFIDGINPKLFGWD